MKNITQRLLATVVLATSCIAAHAATDLSQVPVDITQDLVDYSSSDFGHTFALGLGQQAGSLNNFFADKYTFAISGVNDVVGLITSLKASANDGLTITGFDLRNSGGIVFHGTQDVTNYLPGDQAWSFASGLHPLAAGNYTLEVDGYVASANGGSYSGNIAVAAAVPEPETYGMLLAGLGLLGVLARRRKQAQ
ncbi:FxDxF family PEP-CTERM protein [Rugamonas apoptosis]|uniref:FxDxF family PEP-CTERM protein n=1 Tax=Rugamonas apoptosis TaxID=2758570 RepID=A0A7W2F9J3_9BURK|nr:FxDxF family PEP-CTERM protein [Rugamonas apoptosis]MBA5687597.1 FxDxF family PEP-CTERM protein [Rugamonas apoptosis]